MNASIEICSPGVAVSIQDMGRIGYRNIGVPVSGALDTQLLAAANTLLGNSPNSAAFEIRWSGPSVRAINKPVRVAMAGDINALLTDAQGLRVPVKAWETILILPGQTLSIGTVGRGVAYAAVSGGLLVPVQLNSRSSYSKASIGGLNGRPLNTGDVLPCQEALGDLQKELKATQQWLQERGDIRVILGPQDDYFTANGLANLFNQDWTVSKDMDRMGMRLKGAALEHNTLGADIVSDGVTPGTIQVPASGQPIILLADCQTTGGYSKIATVIRADLSKLAHLRPGDTFRFVAVDHEEALRALKHQRATFERWAGNIHPFLPAGAIDLNSLYTSNLVSGVLCGYEDE